MFFSSVSSSATPFSPQQELQDFHIHITETFSPLNGSGVGENLLEVVKRIARVIIAPFVYLVLASLSYIESTFLKTKALSEELDADDVQFMKRDEYSEIDEWSEEEEKDGVLDRVDLKQIPQYEAMRSIKRARLDIYEEELKRLRKNGTLTSDIEKTIEKALDELDIYGTRSLTKFSQCKALLGRALEIKHLYQDTHYIFTHAQATKYFASVCLIKELVKAFLPESNIKFSQFLRVPQQRTTEVSDFKSILADVENCDSELSDHVGEIRASLLSVDGYLFNNIEGESALNFLYHNYSVLDNKEKAFENLLRIIFSHFIPKKGTDVQLYDLTKKVVKIAENMEPKGIERICGNLYVICVPKELVEDKKKTIVYRAHPYGKPCDCHSEDKDIEILQELQKNHLCDEHLCEDVTTPQFRLLAAALKPENGVFSFALTPFNRSQEKAIKKQIAQVAAEAYEIAQKASL